MWNLADSFADPFNVLQFLGYIIGPPGLLKNLMAPCIASKVLNIILKMPLATFCGLIEPFTALWAGIVLSLIKLPF